MPVLAQMIVSYLVAAFCFYMTIPPIAKSPYPLFHITNGVSIGGFCIGVFNVIYGTIRLIQLF